MKYIKKRNGVYLEIGWERVALKHVCFWTERVKLYLIIFNGKKKNLIYNESSRRLLFDHPTKATYLKDSLCF